MPDLDPITRLNAALEGRYRIERQLGEGGMATVYLADDLRHERKVALKVLKPELAAVVGAERFLAEIKTTANLQHPHILPLFDSGEADGFLFYVMPYVEGESLRERLDREHQLPVDEAVRIATNVAEALDHSHRHGVIHRDIKPANILLRDGKPVVSDFGIALALGVAGRGRLTETGLSLGTPHYMSPEQATGDQTVGAPTDIYALGCVLYETLVGEPPHTGRTPQAVLGRIVTGETPSASAERKSVPPNVDAAIRRALEKVPADRFRSAEELARALADPGFRHGKAAAEGRGLWNPLSVAATGLAAVLAVGLGWSVLGRPAKSPSSLVSRQVVSAAPAAPVAVDISATVDVAVSPDGRTVVYHTGLAPDQLSVRTLDRLESPTLRGPDAAINPFLSPDGRWVAYQAGAGGPLERVSIEGGPPQAIADLPFDLDGASWGPDDMIVLSLNAPKGLYQVRAAGGDITPLTETDASTAHQYPDVLPNGAGVLFTLDTNVTAADDNQIAVLDLRTGEQRVIIQQGSFARYVSGGYIVYEVAGTLMAVAFDAERLEVIGDPVPVIDDVLVKYDGQADFSLSRTGSLAYVSGSLPRVRPASAVWVDDQEDEVPLPPDPQVYFWPRLSPDGARVALGRGEGDVGVALWVFDVGGPTGLRLTQNENVSTPVWLSDDRLAFSAAVRGRTREIYTVTADGSAPPEPLFADTVVGDYPTSVTPDGRDLIFTRFFTPAHREIFEVPLEGDPKPVPLVQGDFIQDDGAVSPDGRWLAYASDQSGQTEIYVRPYLGPGPTVPVSVGGGKRVTWSPDGTELFYRRGDRMMAASFAARGGTPRIGPPSELFRGYYAGGFGRQYDISPDGRFLVLKPVAPAGATDALPPQVVLVQNFTEELNRLVPTD